MKPATVLAAALVSAVFASSAARAQYAFDIIADSADPTFSVLGVPALNNAGTAAFYAVLGAGDTGIFTRTAGGATTDIALSSDPTFSYFDSLLSINNAGTVAFRSWLDGGGTGIFTGSGGMTTEIARSSGPTFNHFGNNPSINMAGTVAFTAELDAGGSGIFTSAGGATTTVADSSSPIFKGFSGNPSINAAGTVAFVALLGDGEFGLYTASGGATTSIAETAGPTFDTYVGSAVINSAGTVAFAAYPEAGGFGYYTSAGGVTTPVIEGRADYNNWGISSINDAGTVAFHLGLNYSSWIYVNDGGKIRRVIGTGDALFGSSVTELSFGHHGFNDSGQVAFSYTLGDGRSGIAVASPVPEPSSAVLLVASGCTVLLRRRRPTPVC